MLIENFLVSMTSTILHTVAKTRHQNFYFIFHQIRFNRLSHKSSRGCIDSLSHRVDIYQPRPIYSIEVCHDDFFRCQNCNKHFELLFLSQIKHGKNFAQMDSFRLQINGQNFFFFFDFKSCDFFVVVAKCDHSMEKSQIQC